MARRTQEILMDRVRLGHLSYAEAINIALFWITESVQKANESAERVNEGLREVADQMKALKDGGPVE